MSKNVAMFVDVANLYYSARGQDVDVDYVALLKAATKGRDLIRAYAYSGLDPDNENQRKFIDFLNKNGYKVLTKDIRKFGDGRVKANLDIELVVDLFRLADRMDIAVIVSGDGDFAPAITALQDKGVRCEVISFRPNTSSDLLAVADEFIDVMKIAGIGRNSKEAKEQRGMSAPEMPAKEVVPEFGFREASPSIAKAALAALKDTRTGGGPSERSRGRGRPAAAVAPPEEPGEALPAGDETAAENGEGDARRRRRRRGGRGRGRARSRTPDAASPTPSETMPGEAGEIGWVELDDLSQLAELEGIGQLEADREYSFQEADAETLAELGLTGEAPETATAPAAPTEGQEPEAKKPARRGRTKKAEPQAEGAQAEAEDAEAKKPARRRSTTTKSARGKTKADAEAAAPEASSAAPEKKPARSRTSRARTGKASEEAGSGEKPARRPRSRAKKSEDGEQSASGADAEGQGIWQRFRGARGSSS